MREIARGLKALGDETRLKIVALLLKEDELCVCDFEKVLGVTQSKSSRHLRYLLNTGILEDRKENIWVYYRISKNLSGEMKALVKAVGDVLSHAKRGDLEKDFARWQNEKKKMMRKPKSAKPCKVCV